MKPFLLSFNAMPQNPDVRWRQRLQSFRKAFSQLSGAAALAQERKLTDLERQGLIQAFEFTHELAWNTLKDFLESHGALNLYGSKDATREAFAKGLRLCTPFARKPAASWPPGTAFSPHHHSFVTATLRLHQPITPTKRPAL